VHKSQGSEFMAVLMPLVSYHPRLCYRNLLYTGVTRARRLMIILGRPETVLQTAANHRKLLRYTNLAAMLAEKLEE
jgi:exodeoxyribonuclease V alpha subunit